MQRLCATTVTAGCLLLCALSPARPALPQLDLSRFRLVEEVPCGEPPTGPAFAEQPAQATRTETILGRPCRVLQDLPESCYFAYRLGQGKGLRPGAVYALAVDYPEDRARTYYIENRGCESNLGFATGAACGDAIKGRYVFLNPESLRYPLSERWETWLTLFTLHDRFPDLKQPRGEGPRPLSPEDGFWVIFAQAPTRQRLRSGGAAVASIRLYEVPDPQSLYVPLRLPPADLPHRHLFWREEMSDGVVQSREESRRGLRDPLDFFEYRARRMRLLGFNTFCTDLLEFGHNQGWDSGPYGGSDWVNQTPDPGRWERVLERLRDGAFNLEVLPYYEYAGSIGAHSLGVQRRCRPLGRADAYTHIAWSEKANADVTDPEALEDARKILELTIVRLRERASFAGAWLRTRPSHLPISFADSALLRFAVEANDRRVATREDLQGDPALRARYYGWWFGKRRAFLEALRDYLRSSGVGGATVLFTPEASEGGPPLPGSPLVTDDPEGWAAALGADEQLRSVKPRSWDETVATGAYLQTLLAPPLTWGGWEWQHSLPQADPQRYRETDGVLLTYPFNRLYTVSSAPALEAFRTPAGLAAVHHYGLNENELDGKTGYFVCDVERAGPYCLLAEARAVAYGDPDWLGYLSSNSFNRGFPAYVRQFSANYLALPALPSGVVEGACADAQVVVRQITTEKHGTYLAVVNVGMTERRGVRVKLPSRGAVTAAATGEAVPTADGVLTLDLYPGELRALVVGG